MKQTLFKAKYEQGKNLSDVVETLVQIAHDEWGVTDVDSLQEYLVQDHGEAAVLAEIPSGKLTKYGIRGVPFLVIQLVGTTTMTTRTNPNATHRPPRPYTFSGARDVESLIEFVS